MQSVVKKSLLCVLCVLCGYSSSLPAAVVNFQLERFTGATNNRPITISLASDPLAQTTNIVFGVPITVQPTNSRASINLLPANYWVRLDQVPTPMFMPVPDSTNIYNAVDLILDGLKHLIKQTNFVGIDIATNVFVKTNEPRPVTFSAPFNSTNITASGSVASTVGFNGAGSGLSNLNASAVSSGTLPDARLSANIPTLSGFNSFQNNNSFAAGLDAAGMTIQPPNAILDYGRLLVGLGNNLFSSNQFQVTTPSGDVSVGTNAVFYGTHANFNGNVTALHFIGDGSGLNGIATGNATNAIANTNGNGYGLTTLQTNLSSQFIGNGSGLTNIQLSGLPSTVLTQNYNGTIIATHFAGDGSLLTSIQATNAIAKTNGSGYGITTLQTNVASQFIGGGITASSLSITGSTSGALSLTDANNALRAQLGTNDNLSLSNAATGFTVTLTNGGAIFSSNVAAANFLGNGAGLSNIQSSFLIASNSDKGGFTNSTTPVIINPTPGNGTAPIALGKVANPYSTFGGPSLSTYQSGPGAPLNIQGGAGGVVFLDAAHKSGNNTPGLTMWGDQAGLGENMLMMFDNNTAGLGIGAFSDVIQTATGLERRSVGGPSSFYIPWVAGSGANLSELPQPGFSIWKNVPLPMIILSTGGGSSTGSNNVLSCTENNITNGLIQNWKTNGLITAFSNAGVRVAIQTDTGWLHPTRELNSGSANFRNLKWDTNRFPDGIPFVANYAHTNNFEFWIDACYCTRPLPFNGSPSEWDVNPLTGSIAQYPFTNSIGPYIQPLITPETVHRDVSLFYSWNCDGLMVHEQDGSIQNLRGYQQTMSRQLADAVTFPGANLAAMQDAFWQRNFTNSHAMGLTMLMLPPWSADIAQGANNLLLDTGFQTTEPQPTSVGICFAFSELRYAYPAMSRFPSASIHPVLHLQDIGSTAQQNFDYTGWQAIASLAAIFNATLQEVYPLFEATNSAFAAVWTNSSFLSVWQDLAQHQSICLSSSTSTNFGKTNSIFAKLLAGGDVLLGFFNEATTSTNLSINISQLARFGYLSNVNYQVTHAFTNTPILATISNTYAVTVPASSAYLVRIQSPAAAALNATNLAGTVPTSNLGSGTASSSTFLRGDQTWATPAGGGLANPLVLSAPGASNTWIVFNNGTAPSNTLPYFIGQSIGNNFAAGGPWDENNADVLTIPIGVNVNGNGNQVKTNFGSMQLNNESTWQNGPNFSQWEYYWIFNTPYTPWGTNYGWRWFSFTPQWKTGSNVFGSAAVGFTADIFSVNNERTNNGQAPFNLTTHTADAGATLDLYGSLTVHDYTSGNSGGITSPTLTVSQSNSTFNIIYDTASSGFKAYSSTNLTFSQFPLVSMTVPFDMGGHTRIGYANGTGGDLLTYNSTDIVLGGTSVAGSGNYTSIRGNSGNDTIFSRAYTAFKWADTHSGSSGGAGVNIMDLTASTGNLQLKGTMSATNGFGSYSTTTYSMTATGYTNTSGRNIRVIGFTGTSVTQSNATLASSFSRGTLTTPTDFVLQTKESVSGSSCAAQQMQDW